MPVVMAGNANRKERQGGTRPRYGTDHSDRSGFFHFLCTFVFCKETETEAGNEKRNNNKHTRTHTPLHSLHARSSARVSCAVGCMTGTRKPLCRRAEAARYKRYAVFNVLILRPITSVELYLHLPDATGNVAWREAAVGTHARAMRRLRRLSTASDSNSHSPSLCRSPHSRTPIMPAAT